MIQHNKPSIGKEEVDAATRVLASGWVAQGKEVAAFENEFCEFLGLPEGHAIAVSSGSSALFLALWVLGAKNKTIGVPVYSCSALSNAVDLIKGTSLFLDVGKNTPNISINDVSENQFDILIAASMFGMPVEVLKSHKYTIIEDIAQALGARVDGRPIGIRGEVGICSFYATKMITAGGQGGMVFSKDKGLIDLIKDYRAFDCREDKKPRFNFQMTDIQAAIGREQLKKLPSFIEKRKELFEIYSALPLIKNKLGESSFFRAILKTKAPEPLIRKLKQVGVSAIIPIEEYELLSTPIEFKNARALSETTVSLPIYPDLAAKEAERVVNIIGDNL